MIDDFCVSSEQEWHLTGMQLINEIKQIAKTKNAAQILVVCGDNDQAKKDFLKKNDLSIVSIWFVGKI